MQTVAVFFGGNSCEREISILTGVFAVNVLQGGEYDVLPVYIHTDGNMYYSQKMQTVDCFKEEKYTSFEKIILFEGGMYACKGKKNKLKRIASIDVALNCCHGGWGEGGGLSGLLEGQNIPLASPDWTSSGVFMDKGTTKLVLRALNIPTLDFIRVNERDYQKRGAFLLRNIEQRLQYPVIVKPAHLGSSIGIAVAGNEEEAKQAIEQAFLLDNRVIVEKYLPDKQDVNCAAYAVNGEIFVSEAELAFGEGVFSFEEKYLKEHGDYGKNSQNEGGRVALKGNIRAQIRAYTKTVYKRMNLQGVVRMDYLVRDEKAYLCEVNTIPGSLAYYFFCDKISDARHFFEGLLAEGVRRHAQEKKQILTTGILQSVTMHKK